MIETFQQLLEQHPHYLLLAVFCISLLESLALIGLLVPGVALLAVCCFLAGSLETPAWQLLGAGFCGAVIGDQLSYWLGVYLRRQPGWQQGDKTWQTKLQNGLKQGEEFFKNYGVLSVVIGRFIGPVRPFIPVVAGLCHMSALAFTVINILSALVWAPAYLLPAYYTAQAVKLHFSSQQIGLMIVLVIGLIAVIQYWRRKSG